MRRETPLQKKTVDRVMHEFKRGELKSGPEGMAGEVRDPNQAIAIELSKARVSNRKPPVRNAKSRLTTKAKEAKGETAQQRREGRFVSSRTRRELYEEAKRRNVSGRSKMSKSQLEEALN